MQITRHMKNGDDDITDDENGKNELLDVVGGVDDRDGLFDFEVDLNRGNNIFVLGRYLQWCDQNIIWH